MTTSGLSPDAKEFVPFIQISPLPTTIPYYVGENTIASVYSTDQQPLMYPLIKIPEIEFHIPSSNNDNSSQIVLLPTPGCYPGTPMSTFYPIDYSLQQSKSNQNSSVRSQRGMNHSSHRNSHYDQQGSASHNHRNFHPTNSKPISRGTHSRSIQQKKDHESSFALRVEDFPSLPINHQQSDKIPVIDTKLVDRINR
jgi:hypothetical protein